MRKKDGFQPKGEPALPKTPPTGGSSARKPLMPELTEDSPEVILAFELLAPWYPVFAHSDLRKQIHGNRGYAHGVVVGARKLAAEGKLGPVPQPEPVTWEPTSDYRLRDTYNRVSGAPRDFRLVRRWRSSAGAEEWRDVEAGG